ncbi:MAG: hypothetical protein DRJ45_08330, partial [Thermoprotei archaeon]
MKILFLVFSFIACAISSLGQVIQNDCTVEGGIVYGGQRFLAQRIIINNSDTPTAYAANKVEIKNGVSGRSGLPWDYVERVEIVQALNGSTLGSLHPGTGTGTVTVRISYQVPAYSQGKLEVWLTLKSVVPGGLKFQAQCKVNDTDVDYTNHPAATFTVGAPDGLQVSSLDIHNQEVFGGQRFLAQKLKLSDNDADPYSVNVGSVVIKNVPAKDALGENYFAKIEIQAESNGSIVGQTTSLWGINGTGVRIPLSGVKVEDDSSIVLQVWVTLRKTVPPDRYIKLETEVWHSEGAEEFAESSGAGPAEFTTKEPGGLEATDVTGRGDSIFGGTTAMVQRFKLQHRYPNDPNDVVVTGFKVRNEASDPQLSSSYVDGIEMRTEDGTSVAKTTSVGGFTGGGVFLPANFTVKPGSPVVLEVWLFLKESTPEGKKVRIKTTISQRVGTKPLNDVTVSTQATFVTAVDHPPQVDFSWNPRKPKWSDEIEFDPSWSDPQDPRGRDPIVYSRWDFGDGKTVEQDGPPE